ncbi:MAG: CocE/NonD family hydrolase [Bacteroidota bacterium]|nr:CocE/NonD family hydrolase [Bacteroidota bacterium]
MNFLKRRSHLLMIFLLFQIPFLCLFAQNEDSAYVASHYTKYEFRIPMRDGVKLFTAVYVPKDSSKDYPIILNRTPYNVGPYGIDKYDYPLGPSMAFTKEGFIFASQDVRGRFMSEGGFVDVRPNRNDPDSLDESRDTYDTIDWLIKNIRHNNGKVGMWGISYPGFYAAMGAIDAHPALKAVSPQAPVADWFIDDDFHRNGALWLPHFFNFYAVFGRERKELTTKWGKGLSLGTPDGYKFFLDLGPLKNINKKYYHNEIKFWNEIIKHPDYDKFWQERSLIPNLKNIKPAILTVGGWFDAEDLYGALNVYKSIEKKNPSADSRLVMGPWYHGAWGRSKGEALGNISFGQETGPYFLDSIELPFFNHYLKDKQDPGLSEATVFETGSNRWQHYEVWPPKNSMQRKLYFHPDGKLSFSKPDVKSKNDHDEYISDPAKPVPYTSKITTGMDKDYMVEDQRFVCSRPDVLSYESDTLENDVTFAGPLKADLFISTTGTDADYIVKLIDVMPDYTQDNFVSSGTCPAKMGGYQMMVRGEIMRARYRNSFEKPEALKPNEVAKVDFALQDVNHTFKKGHKIMIQIQSSWFPLSDRNPQKFVNIYEADEKDFHKEVQRIYHSQKYPSGVYVNVLEK